MSTIEVPLVDIILQGSSKTHHLATNFPITTLKRISERFASDFHLAKPDVIKVLNEDRLQWTIRDPRGILSIKGFRLLFTWLCNVLPNPHPAGPNALPTDSTGERWGLLGAVSVRQVCQYLQLAGEIGDQRSASVWLFKFLKGRWTFEWDHKMLGWEEAVPRGWDDVVCAWVYMGEWPDARPWRNRLLNLAIARVHYWALDRAKTEHEHLLAAIREYHGRANDFKIWYEQLTKEPHRPRRFFNLDHQRLRYSLAELNEVPEPRSCSPVDRNRSSQVDTPMPRYRNEEGRLPQPENPTLDYGDEDPGGPAKSKDPKDVMTPSDEASDDLDENQRSDRGKMPIEQAASAHIDTPMMGVDAEEGEIDEIGEMLKSQDRKRKREERREFFRRKKRERASFDAPHDMYRP